MPKKTTEYPDQVNVLCPKDTLILLRSIGFYRGEDGQFAGPARDFIVQGVRQWTESLSPTERKRFESIVENVRVMQAHGATVRKK